MLEVIPVDDPDDPRFTQFRLNERRLANRAERRDDAGAGMFLAEGDLVVERALTAGCEPVAALVDIERVPPVAASLDCPLYGGSERVRAHVAGLGVPAPVIALFRRPPRPTVAELAISCDRIVVAEAVDNPANVGAIIRNAAALGWQGFVLDHTSADPLARRSLRVAMGTVFDLPHARTTKLADELAALTQIDASLTLYALTPDPAAIDIATISPVGRRAVLVGSERAGLSDELLALATPVRIPMVGGVDSLNVAAATAIACYALGPATFGHRPRIPVELQS